MYIKSLIKKIILASVGLFFYGFCVYSFIQMNIGVGPWDVFCIGLSKTLNIKYGNASIAISVIIIIVDLLMKEKIGIGTILDAIIVGKTVDLFNAINLIPAIEHNYLLSIVGLILVFIGEGIAQFLYMKAGLSCGPRDSLQIALGKRLSKLPIGVVNIILLCVVFIVGFFLGGPYGIGTLLAPFGIGFAQDLVFKITKFDPKSIKHESIIDSFKNLKNNALVVLNGDDERLKNVKPQDLKNVENAQVVFYGKENEEGKSAFAQEVHLQGVRGVEIKGTLYDNTFSLKEPLPGEHNVWNVLAALLIGHHFGMTMEEMKAGVLSVPVMPGRNHLISCDKLLVFDDCYNANPASMKSSLDVLSQESGRKVAILGDMGELGDNKENLHLEVGQYAGKADIDVVYTVGELSLYTARGVRSENQSIKVRSFDTKEDLYPVLKKELKEGDTVLVKASHFMQFENIVKFLEENYND